MGAIEFAFWISVVLCLYPYFGYPLLLIGLAAVRRRPVAKGDVTPTVSVIIAAHNEERQLAAKIENTLSLDYPQGRMELIVASDGSTDATEEIAARYEKEGVRLLRLARCGKLRALNQGVASASGEILVLTDANAALEPVALRELVAPFADAQVGGVCGNQKFFRPSGLEESAAGGENFYWTYDKYLKKLETQVGSTIAADGSIYALRRELYPRIEDGAQADDFAISARVVTRGGKRLVYEPAAISYEPPPAVSDLEFRRKIRVANHSLRSILSLEGGLNPFRTGLYAVELWSHKMFRYLLPVFALVALLTSAVLAPSSALYLLLLVGQLLFYVLALAGWTLRRSPWGRIKAFTLPFYFCLANAAVLVGALSLLKGERIVTWQPQRET